MEKENKHHTEQPDGSMLIDFSDRPIKIDGTDVKQLTMREPDVEDQIAAQKMGEDPAEVEIINFANLLDLTPDQVRKFKMRHYSRVKAAYEDFFT